MITLEVADDGLIWKKDPFLFIKRHVIVPTSQLGPIEANIEGNEEGNDEEEDEARIIPELSKLKRTTSKLDCKGNAVAKSQENSKKKITLPKIDEVPRRKRKLLDESTLAAMELEVHF